MPVGDGYSNQGYQMGNIPVHSFQHLSYTNMESGMQPPPQGLMMTRGGPTVPPSQSLMMSGVEQLGAVHEMQPLLQGQMNAGGGQTEAVHEIYQNSQV